MFHECLADPETAIYQLYDFQLGPFLHLLFTELFLATKFEQTCLQLSVLCVYFLRLEKNRRKKGCLTADVMKAILFSVIKRFHR